MSVVEKRKKNLWVPVVTGLILKEHQVLMGCRPENKNFAGKWEFPGGKIEPDESPEEALSRELREEIDIEILKPQLLFANTHNYGDMSVLLIFYKILYWKGSPKSKYHTQLEWVPLELIHKYDQPEANLKFLSQILRYLKNESDTHSI